MKTLRDMPTLKGKKVLVRVDFNVPLDDQGNVKNDKRIRHALPTLKYLLDHGASQLILMSHVGRPKNNEPNLRTDKIAAHLEKMMGEKVAKVDGWSGIPSAKIILLENLRFHPGEKSKVETERDAFGKELANLADFYVNEAFSNCHRSHASMTSVPKFIPGFVGFGVEHEVSSIQKALQNPEHPMVAVIGGLKADKLPTIAYLSVVADHVLVAGAVAFALLKAQGIKVGSSKIDEEGMSEMAELVKKITGNSKVLLPQDAVVADAFAETANHKIVPVNGIEDGWMALDVGPKTVETYAALIRKAKTVLWFGPIGVFEWKAFSGGTRSIGQAIANTSGLKIVGGGDSAGAVESLGLADQMTLVSTGGGASLEMVEGKALPAIKSLE
ncbi:MAG: phosphoglycerate kinase [Candidatus Peregrinibacteria bacterium]